MQTVELILLSVGLAMDACAVSMTNGLCYPQMRAKHITGTALCFGLMQGLMPLLGYLLGSCFAGVISAFDHPLALILLGFIGVKMIAESLRSEDDTPEDPLSVRLVLLQGLATSIDALAVGISFAAFSAFAIVPAVLCIGCITALLSAAGTLTGRQLGGMLRSKAQLLGGLILIAIGIKIFVEHTAMAY